MTHNFEPYRRAGPFRASLLATLLVLPFGACSTDEVTRTTEDLSNPAGLAEPVTAVAVETPSFASSFRGGIPIGTSDQPTTAFGDRFNGALRNDGPGALLKELVAIKARGGKVMIGFPRNQKYYRTRNGHFDLGKWKAKVDEYRKINFSAFINDGTIVGHYMLDEPNDAHNWNGVRVTPEVLEEMARYSKQIWPTLPTIVRVEPGYLASNHRYLDAAWAQYVMRKGTAPAYLSRNVAEAQKKGLGLIVGLNVMKGGPNNRRLTANEIREMGSAMLSGSYPCAFISWKYDPYYLSRSDIASAMSYLAGKARAKTAKSCRGGGGSGGGGGGGGAISLRVSGRQLSRQQLITVTWSGAKGANVVVYRDGNHITTRNDGRYVNVRRVRGRGSYLYKVCQKSPSVCSKQVRVVVQ